MKRVALLLLVVTLPLVAAAQPRPVLGYLGAESPERFASRVEAFRRGLAEMGYVEGRNVAIEYRWAAGDNSRLPSLAAELVQLKVDVIVAPGSAVSAYAARNATSTIPIVFELGIDPVAAGLVESMNRPGGNLTGVTSLNTPIMVKRLELLSEALPRARSFALLVNPTNPRNAEDVAAALQATARARGLQLHVVRAATERELAEAIESIARLRVGGLVIANDTFFANRGRELAELTMSKRIPAIHLSRDFVAAGGLMSYAGSFEESHRLAGVYAGRVLKGEKPASLPIQQARKTEFYVNLRTAKTLGITVPRSLLARAEQVLE
jgi:ABC-type uncharacterized transport system substrate-binding protein